LIRSVSDTGTVNERSADMKPERRRLSPEERAELHRMLLEIVYGRPRRRPMLVCENGQVVGEANVNVSPSDPNWNGREIKVRR